MSFNFNILNNLFDIHKTDNKSTELNKEEKAEKTITKLKEGEKIVYRSVSKKHKELQKIIVLSQFDENTKTFIIYVNPFENYLKISKKSVYPLKYYCEDCNLYFNKDEGLMHLINTKHFVIKEIEKKCDIHNKELIYFDLITFKICCEGCSKSGTIPILYKPSHILYSNLDSYAGPLKNFKKEGKGTYIYAPFSILKANFINDLPQLPCTYMNLDLKFVNISEKWGDIREYKIVDFHKPNFLKILKIVLDKYKLKTIYLLDDFEVKVNIYYDIHKNPWYKVYFCNVYFFTKRDTYEFLKVFQTINKIVESWLLQYYPHITINLIIRMKKGYSYNFHLFIFSKIVKKIDETSNESFSYTPFKIDNSDQYKILFFFEFSDRDISKIIETQKKLDSFNKLNFNILNDFKIYFIYMEKDLSKRNKISSTIFKNELNVKIINAFLEHKTSKNDPINIFQYTKYLLNAYFLIFNGKNFKISKMGLIESFERKFFDFKFPPEEKKEGYIQRKLDLMDLIYNTQKKLDYYTNLRVLIPLRLSIKELGSKDKNYKILDLIPVQKTKLSIIGSLKENDLLNLKNEFTKFIFEKDIKIKQIITFPFDIENLVKECNNCKRILNDNEEIYACFWCKIAFCEKCVEDKINDEKNIGKEKLIHKEHNLLYFKTRNKEKFLNLEKKKLGNNLFHSIPEKLWTLKHNMICNGCLKSKLISPRYLCLTCRPGDALKGGYVDFCYECIKHLRNKDSKGFEYENIECKESKNLKCPLIKYKHKHNEHVYLCIIFNATFNYYLF